MEMSIFLSWPQGWYYIAAFLIAVWIGLMWYRKDYKMRRQLAVGLVVTLLALTIEFIAVFNGVWNYVPGNWPIILWPHYFLSGMVMFQIVRLFDKK